MLDIHQSQVGIDKTTSTGTKVIVHVSFKMFLGTSILEAFQHLLQTGGLQASELDEMSMASLALRAFAARITASFPNLPAPGLHLGWAERQCRWEPLGAGAKRIPQTVGLVY